MKALATLFTATVLLAAGTDFSSAWSKFHKLSIGAYPPGTHVTITARELNAYLQAEAAGFLGQGVRNPRIETDAGNVARGYLLIDFVKVRQAHGTPPGWLMSKLLAGERPVVITARITSANRRARVDVLRVEVSGVAIEGAALDFLISNFVLPTFPEAKIAQDFALDYNIDRLEIRATGVTVVLR